MRKLTTEQRAQLLTALVEGNSIASTCRMFGVNKITVLRLLADAGTLAQQYHDLTVCNLESKRVQLDEIWSFIHCKNANVNPRNWNPTHGDNWTWVSLDADSKLAINWLVGNRSSTYANRFIEDLAERLNDRAQITSDGWMPYRSAIYKAFGTNVDYAVLVKQYAGQQSTVRYSPPVYVGAHVTVLSGNPDAKHISTSYSERQNLTMRMSMRRFTRLTNGFSKKIENHKHMVAVYCFHYNFIRVHQTLSTTPAMAANVADKVWKMVDFVELLEREESLLGGRLTDYKPASSKKHPEA